MSLYCPKCWAKAKCIDSRPDPRTNTVRRRLQCKDPACAHRFTSVEIIVGAFDMRAGPQSKLMELAWEIFDQLGIDHTDAAFVESWAERKAKRPA